MRFCQIVLGSKLNEKNSEKQRCNYPLLKFFLHGNVNVKLLGAICPPKNSLNCVFAVLLRCYITKCGNETRIIMLKLQEAELTRKVLSNYSIFCQGLQNCVRFSQLICHILRVVPF